MVFESNPSNQETWSIWWHVGIHVDFTSILHSHTPLGPSSALCSELGLAPPLPPTRVLEVQWSRALSLVCEVTLRTKPWNHGTPNHQSIIFYHVGRLRMNRNSSKLHVIENPVTYDFTPHSRARDHPTLHYFGSVMGWPLGTSIWALTISQSRSLHLSFVCVRRWP